MARFRAKQVQAEGFQFDGTEASAVSVSNWINANGGRGGYGPHGDGSFFVELFTPEGSVRLGPTEWALKDGSGFWRVTPDALAVRYDTLAN